MHELHSTADLDIWKIGRILEKKPPLNTIIYIDEALFSG